VVADIAKLLVGREEYYTRELATDHEQYLSGHGESPGRWYGAGARSLGLQGEASGAGFQAMFEGRHPDTDQLLGRPHGRKAVPAFDVVLRPTKSVSILYGLGDPATGRTVLAAQHAGLAEAVGYLDEHLGARRGHGGHEHVSGQGLLAVGFDHRTSREGDPLLHTHLVVANRIQGPDGRWTALDGRDLYRHRLAADAIYRATYQLQLSRTLGVEWTPADAYGNRELQGIPEGLVRCFSKRTGQIDAELDRLGADGGERTPRLVKWAVHATRKPKEHESPDTLYGRWRTEAAERGHDPDSLVRAVTGRTANRGQDQAVSDAIAGRLFDRLAGPEGLTEHASTFTRPDVLVALGAGLVGAGRAELRVDLAYATTGHRAQGLTRGQALVRLTGGEDVNWLYVQLSRARQDTRLYAVVGPEPQGAGELDLPDRDQPDAYLQLAQALSRAGGQTLAIDTPSSPDLQRLSTAGLRAERDRLRRQLDQAPRDRARELARATAHREHAEEALAAHQSAIGRQPAGMLRWRRRGEEPARIPGGVAVATQQANRAHDRERELRQHQHHRQGWLEANAHLGPQYRQVVRALAWQRRATGLAIEAERPGYVLEALGPVPESTRGRRAWRPPAAEIEHYRHTHGITDPVLALGPEPADRAQRAARQRVRTAIDRVQAKQRAFDLTRDARPTSERTTKPRSGEQRGRPGPERAAG
jgi:conjugative relaxase-like TrwC/TraI family protein